MTKQSVAMKKILPGNGWAVLDTGKRYYQNNSGFDVYYAYGDTTGLAKNDGFLLRQGETLANLDDSTVSIFRSLTKTALISYATIQ